MSTLAVPGKSLLKYYKETAGQPGVSLGLAVGKPYVAFLRPVPTQPQFINRADVELLTTWRNKYVTSFLTEFNATTGQTAHWLSKTVGPDDGRILFMVDDPNGRTFGYMGIAFINWNLGYVEADAVVRGESAPPGTMSAALKALLTWTRTHLGLNDIHVRVRSDNSALDFYRKVGFIEEKRVSLHRTVQGENVTWAENNSLTNPAVTLVYMKLDPKAFS